MRTTVTIDDHLLDAAKQEALRQGKTVGSVLEDALRLLLSRTTQRPPAQVSLRTYGGSGLLPGVDLEDKDALATLLGDDAPR